MSTNIENQVVQMQFDNAQFERNVATSVSSLDKLKQSLDLKGASKGLENVDAAARRVDMPGLGSAVEAVQAKFSALSVMGVTALANITNSAVNAGKRIVSALTIDPVRTGFSEYETKINAIQTIMSNTASKGTTMEDVTRVIGELNTYADKTIYNFAEMTRNIGTFTAAGVGLEESASAIQGIANLAAASGSTSQQASTAMYQLSQALAAGTVKLMDWNSVVNAGMGGEKFQEALKSTAREHGIAVDDLIKKHGSFRESLSEGWISADILNETLRKFTVEGAKEYADSMVKSGKYTQAQADALIKEAQAMEDAATKVKTFTQLWDTLKESAQSGWSQTWEIIVGDFEEAKETLTKFSEVIGGMIEASANARNELLQGWKDAGGRADLVDSLFNIFESVMSVVKPIKEAFREIFPATTVDQLVGITRSIKEFTAKLKLSETTSNKLKRTFKGLFAVLDIVKQVFSALFKAVGPLFGVVGDLGGGFLGITAALGDWLVKLNETIKRSELFSKIFNTIAKVVTTVYGLLKTVLGSIAEKIVFPGFELFHKLLERIYARLSGVGDAAAKMKSGVVNAFESTGSALENCTFVKLLQALWNAIVKISSGVAKVLGSLVGGLVDKLSNANFDGIFDFINSLSFSAIAIFIAKFVKGFSDIVDSVGGFKDSVVGILDSVKGCFEAWQTSIKADALKKIAVAIAILAASLLVLSLIDSGKLSDAIGAITVLFVELLLAMNVFSKITGDFTGVFKVGTAMIAMSTAVLILAAAMKTISDMNFEELSAGLIGIAGLMAIVVVTAKALSDSGAVVKGALRMVIFAAAIKILASACEDLSYLDWDELSRGLVGVGALMTELFIFMDNAKFEGKTLSTTIGIVVLAAAIKILASACADIGEMDFGAMAKGLLGVGALLAGLIAFTKFTSGATKMMSIGISMIAIGVALKIFVSSVEDLASMSWGNLLKGLLGMAGALYAIATMVKLMPTNLMSTGIALVAVSTGLVILANALGKMAGMSWTGLAKSLLALGGALGILAVGLNAMRKTAGGSAALLVAAVALAAIAPTLAFLGAMSWKAIVKGLVSIAGAFAVIGVAGLVLRPIIPTILALSGALFLVGLGVLAAGAGLAAFGAGLTALSVGFTALFSALSVVVAGIIGVISALITGILKGVGEGIVAFCEVIYNGIPAIGNAIKAIVLTICDVLSECVPDVVRVIVKVILTVLEALANYAPIIIDFLAKFIVGVIKGLAAHMPEIIQAIFELIGSIFSGVLKALGNLDFDRLVELIAGVGLIAAVMAALSAVSKLTAAAMKGVLGMAVVLAELTLVFAAFGALAQIEGLTWIINEGGKLLEAVGTAIGRFIGGVVGGFVGGIAAGATSSLPKIATNLSNFMRNIQPFLDGAKSINATTFKGVEALIDIIGALSAAGLMDSIAYWISGRSSLAKFGEEIAEFGPNIKKYADSVKGIDESSVKASAVAAMAIANMTRAIPNEGGVAAWFAGENSISKFGDEIDELGKGLASFSNHARNVDPAEVTAAANAAKALAEMTKIIPNEGGVVSWFAGENSISNFGNDIGDLGEGLAKFSSAAEDVIPDKVKAATDAAKELAKMTDVIPNEGGVASWFAGENSISKFSTDLESLGIGLSNFSAATENVAPATVIAAANAAKALAEMTATIPNEGGMVAWFTGDNSMSKFSDELLDLGVGLTAFSVSVTNIIPENITAAANAAKALAEMAAIIPNEGGMVAWFKGENSVATFAHQLLPLGLGLAKFSVAVENINAENITAAAQAAKGLAEMAAILPNQGGMAAWFAGDSSVAAFSGDLLNLGVGLAAFSVAVTNVDPVAVTAAANAAKALAEMAAVIPNQGGMTTWFAGDNSVATFAHQLLPLGTGLAKFSLAVAEVNPENVTAAASAAKALATMADTIPNEGGMKSWFTGDNSVASFAGKLPALGKGLADFSAATADIVPENVTAAAKAAKGLAEMAAALPKDGGMGSWFSGNKDIAKFGGKLKDFGEAMADYSDTVKGIDVSSLSNATSAFKELANMARGISDVNFKGLGSFGKNLGKIGKDGVNKFIEAFEDATDRVAKAGKSLITNLISGAEDAAKSIKKTFSAFVDDAVSALEGEYDSFYDAGAYLVKGFAAGISQNDYQAEAKARAMAKAAAKAAEDALDINSPSKVFRAIGASVPEGFALGIEQLGGEVKSSTVTMTDSALNSVRGAISRIASVVDGELDVQPTIRPVLDLSDVRSGANTLGSLLGGDSLVGVTANVGSINTAMNRRGQNGGNDDLISAIKDLRKDMSKVGGNTYNLNGISYEEGSDVADAFKTIIRAAKLERRT